MLQFGLTLLSILVTTRCPVSSVITGDGPRTGTHTKLPAALADLGIQATKQADRGAGPAGTAEADNPRR